MRISQGEPAIPPGTPLAHLQLGMPWGSLGLSATHLEAKHQAQCHLFDQRGLWAPTESARGQHPLLRAVIYVVHSRSFGSPSPVTQVWDLPGFQPTLYDTHITPSLSYFLQATQDGLGAAGFTKAYAHTQKVDKSHAPARTGRGQQMPLSQ